jgi:hypothetical protein
MMFRCAYWQLLKFHRAPVSFLVYLPEPMNLPFG